MFEFLGGFAKLLKTTVSFVMSVRIEQLGSQPTDFIEFDIWAFFENLLRKYKFH